MLMEDSPSKSNPPSQSMNDSINIDIEPPNPLRTLKNQLNLLVQSHSPIPDPSSIKVQVYDAIYGSLSSKQVTKSEIQEILVLLKQIFLASDEDTKNLITLPNNRLEAAPGFHDDSLMSYLIARWAIYYGKNMQKLFGIGKIASPENGDKENVGMSALRMMANIERIEQKANMKPNSSIAQFSQYEELDRKIENPNSQNNSMLKKIADWNK